jgi:hypothetical protein
MMLNAAFASALTLTPSLDLNNPRFTRLPRYFSCFLTSSRSSAEKRHLNEVLGVPLPQVHLLFPSLVVPDNNLTKVINNTIINEFPGRLVEVVPDLVVSSHS